MRYKRELLNKKTGEIVLYNIDYVFDDENEVYYVHDSIELDDDKLIVNFYYTLDTNYNLTGIIYNDYFDSFTLPNLELTLKESLDEYKEFLTAAAEKERTRRINHLTQINDTMVKARKRVKPNDKR